METETSSAAEVTRRSRSNLAFALWSLPVAKRRDMTTFYAFCRQVDDLADEPTASRKERQAQLDRWKAVIRGTTGPETPVERGLRDLMGRYPVKPEVLEEIVLGMEMDLRGETYPTYAALERYCYRVASAVGLVSIEIFGYRQERARAYAVELGHALQLTNILRDVGEDVRNERRVYLPIEDMDRFGVSIDDLAQGRETEGFLRLMEFEAERARSRYARAAELCPVKDRGNLRASELMRKIYHALFRKMERDGFRVLSRRYRLSWMEKVFLLLGNGLGR